MIDGIELARALIRCPSVTPLDEGAQDVLIRILEPAGFVCTKLQFGAVRNLFARRGTGGAHLCFAGHTDVVPAGDESAWTHPPFSATVANGKLYGRGAADMKGNIAAFAAAAVKTRTKDNSISLLITGDEEGPATDGTVRVLEWMAENGHVPDACVVGEPSCPEALGDEIKIGRRGSLGCTLGVAGVQGHVAYPHLANNPIPKIARLIGALSAHVWDNGTPHFGPTTLQFSTVDVGNPAANVIPAMASARFNLRFNDLWTAETLEAEIRRILDETALPYALTAQCGAPCFLTEPGPFSALVSGAVEKITGRAPALSTAGGTSDARFIHKYCPVVECGLVNKTIHQTDECVAVEDVKNLEAVYAEIIARFFA